MATCDVVIAGGGIIGLSTAWQLARRSSLKIVVLEKGAGVGEGSTGASSAVCRFRYSSDQMVNLARDGIYAYRDWRAFCALKEPRARFHAHGVLWMPGADLKWADREHARMAKLGIPTAVLDDADVRQRFSSVGTCTQQVDLETGSAHECRGGSRSLLELEGGYMDPVAAAQDLVEACRGAGVEVRFKTAVTGVKTAGGRVQGVTLSDGETLAAPLLINATGPWFRRLFDAAKLELKWDLAPVRIQMLYRDIPAQFGQHIPVVVDMPSGIYFRTQNRRQQLVVGSVLEEDEREVVSDPDSFQTVHDEQFQHEKMHLLHHRLPDMPYSGKIRGYCGLYTVNRDDVHPLLGPTEIEGLWAANGFSGHGFKLAPAIGSMLAQAISGERCDFDTGVPLSFLGFDRAPIQADSKSVLA